MRETSPSLPVPHGDLDNATLRDRLAALRGNLPRATKPRTALIVAGMHRSGTSAAAGLFAQLGASLGPRLMAASADNPRGYFENLDVVEVHDALLKAFGRSWSDPRSLPAGWQLHPVTSAMEHALARWLDAVFPSDPVILVKDPRISRFLPLWCKVLRAKGFDTRVLHVLRHPGEVAASLHARDSMTWNQGLLLWAACNMDIAACRTQADVRMLAYPEFMHGDLEAVDDDLLARLGRGREQARLAAAQFLDPELRRQRDIVFPQDLLPGLQGIVLRMYAALRDPADDLAQVQAAWNRGIAPMLA